MPYRAITVHDVIVLSFPPNDEVFGRPARTIVRERPDAAPADLEAALRESYLRAVVRARDAVVNFGAERVWYAYRDGRYSPFVRTRWWEDPAAATVIIEDGRYLDANDAALTLMGVDLEGLRSAQPGDFTTPGYRAIVPWLLKLLEDAGELHSVSMLLPRGAGTPTPVEFHVRRDQASTGRIPSCFRVVPADAVEPPQ
ncbi:MAG TPA: PAS domain-containing protein [Candidatus Limnocylindrales bacterium]|nr:PAS domain-containing protein [Candidatus Limnocylindrales bacterium]